MTKKNDNCINIFFLNKIDKKAIFGLHISKILHENNFWTKKRLFLRVY